MIYDTVAVLIPAYKPDERLNALVDELAEKGFTRVTVVDDGGGEAYAPIFEKLRGQGARVLTHDVNKGKGEALKTGLKALSQEELCGVVTADADGQHTPRDIARVADALISNPDSLIIGARDKRQMPPRSRAGNTLTCFVFGVTTGLWVSDTQTGLRGLPKKHLDAFSALDGARYEYEQNMLIDARHKRIPVTEVAIETVYLDGNASSHFHGLKDGLRIYYLLFKQVGAFAGSSLLSSGVDYLVYFIMRHLFPSVVLPAVIAARACSSLLNYFVNRAFVFKTRRHFGSLVKYYLLVGVVALGSYLGIRLFTALGLPEFPAKIISDVLMFLLSYNVQQKVVFKNASAE